VTISSLSDAGNAIRAGKSTGDVLSDFFKFRCFGFIQLSRSLNFAMQDALDTLLICHLTCFTKNHSRCQHAQARITTSRQSPVAWWNKPLASTWFASAANQSLVEADFSGE